MIREKLAAAYEYIQAMALVAYATVTAMFSTRSLKPLERMVKDSSGIADLVLGGIMVVIIGFAMIIIGIYIYFTIQTSLPTIASTSYNSTVTSINSYATTVFPLMGLVLMILGFAIIFIALRMGLGGAAPGGKR